MSRRPFILPFICIAAALTLSAQVPDSKGTDFWFTFLPNFHNNASNIPGNPALELEHQLYIYIGAEAPTRGTITLRNRQGESTVVPFQIDDPRDLFEFKTFFMPYELYGWGNHGELDLTNMQTEKKAQQSVHIVAESDVTVYALNQGDLTSDAFMILPTDALGDDYVVMAYTSDITVVNPTTPEITGGSTPTQFAFVATQDSTIVTYIPSTATFTVDSGEMQEVMLNAGDSYLVQPDPYRNFRSDLTGSIVRANKPIAVFGGHQRATLPIEDKGFLGSRDCLVEQINPIVTWGKSAFITPLAVSSDEADVGANLFRVVAAFDSTEIYVDDELITTIQAGQFFEDSLLKASVVETTKPAMVAMFKKTAGPGTIGLARFGDPFMMLVPPFEQFMDSYRFINIQAYDYSIINNKPVPLNTIYEEQWLNVVIPNAFTGSLRIDNQPVNASFQPIGASGFSWAQIRMTDGVHAIKADTIFGIYVYGYGRANSYGYIGGMAFRPLDVNSPRVRGTTLCNIFAGRVTDSLLGDTKLRVVEVVPGTEVNVNVTLGPFAPPQAVVTFQAALIDRFQDGSMTIEATDNVRQTTRTNINLPGFTVAALGLGPNKEPLARRTILPVGRNRCDTIFLENYGRFAHTISNLRTTSGATITGVTPPFTIDPGEQVLVEICRFFDAGGIYHDTLVVGDTCISRLTATIEYDVRDDQEAPDITGTADQCSTSVDILIADNRAFDFGIQDITVREDILVNCTVDTISISVAAARFRVNVLNPLLDAIYGFEAVDSAGNKNVRIDTVGGFTLAINGDDSLFTSQTLQKVALGSTRCDSVIISNYGITVQVIDAVFVRGNVRFSVPQSQLPVVIPPGASRSIAVCYEPLDSDTVPDVDTMEIVRGCLVRALEVKAIGDEVAYEGLSRCDIPVHLTVERIPGTAILVPNPVEDHVTVVLPAEANSLRIHMIDMNGREVMSRYWSGAPCRSFLLDVTELPRGTYAVILEYEDGVGHDVLIVR